MSAQTNRITGATRTKLTMLFSAIQAEVPNKTLDELHKLASEFIAPTPIAKTTVRVIITDMGLSYKPSRAPNTQKHGTLQRDTLRAVCAWIANFDATLPADALIRKFIKP